MTEQKKISLTNEPTDIADSATDAMVTVQNQTGVTIGITVDSRLQADRVIAGDDIDYLIPPMGERQFNGFTGKITAKTKTDGATGNLLVMKS